LILACASLGLALTGTAAFTPGFWWFVAVLALARPLLSATNAVAIVVGAEVTKTKSRSTAVAVIGATYAVGSGIPALLRGVVDDLGFRPLFALAFVILAIVPFGTRRLKETDLFKRLARPEPGQIRRGGALSPDLRSRLLILALLTALAALVTGPANTFVFYFAETIRGLRPSTMAAAVLAAGPIGLLGLLVGRWTADNIGRRLSAAASLSAIAGAAIFTYNVRGVGVVAGYLMAIFAASVFTPAAGAISAELFPTSSRSTAAGWLTAAGVLGAVGGLTLFGSLADVLGGFGRASTALAVPVIFLSALYMSLPETRSIELEDPAPEGPLLPPL
jgi:MFS family permease